MFQCLYFLIECLQLFDNKLCWPQPFIVTTEQLISLKSPLFIMCDHLFCKLFILFLFQWLCIKTVFSPPVLKLGNHTRLVFTTELAFNVSFLMLLYVVMLPSTQPCYIPFSKFLILSCVRIDPSSRNHRTIRAYLFVHIRSYPFVHIYYIYYIK